MNNNEQQLLHLKFDWDIFTFKWVCNYLQHQSWYVCYLTGFAENLFLLTYCGTVSYDHPVFKATALKTHQWWMQVP